MMEPLPRYEGLDDSSGVVDTIVNSVFGLILALWSHNEIQWWYCFQCWRPKKRGVTKILFQANRG